MAASTAGALVALDVQALQVEGYADRGVGRFVSGYSAALVGHGRLGAALMAPELPPPRGLPGPVTSSGLARWDTQAEMRRLCSGDRGVVWHLTAPFLHTGATDLEHLVVAPHWDRPPVRRVVLLHDLIPLRAPRHYLPDPIARSRFDRRAAWLAESDLIVTNSRYTRSEALDLLGCPAERVVTIGAGVSPFFTPADGTDDELWRFHFPDLQGRPFVLLAGGSDARKGGETAVASLALMVARGLDIRMVVAGHLSDEWRRRLWMAATALGVADRVVIPLALGDELLRAGYRRAECTVMPSLAEGAGLPVLESAACGAPVAASATAALGEAAVTEEALFDPTDADAMAVTVERMLTDTDRRGRILGLQRRLAAESAWDRVAERALTAIDRLDVQPVHVPLQVAVVGPPTPRLAAAATGLETVAPELELHHFGAGQGDGPAWAQDGFGSSFRPASFDQVFYRLDGPGQPEWVWRLAARFPGWVCLDRVDGSAPLEPVVRRAAGVVVASEEAARLVAWQLAPGAARPPVIVAGTSAGRSPGAPPGLRAALAGS